MNVTLPDGTVVQNVPDGTSKADLFAKLKANGHPVDESWLAPKPEAGIGQKIVGGAETALSAASSIPATLAGNAYGVYKTATSGKFGTQEGIDQGQQAGAELAQKMTYQPRTEAGQQMTQELGEALDNSKLAGLPAEASALGAMAKGAPAAGAEAGNMARSSGGAIAKTVPSLPTIAPETAALAKRATDLGIPIRPDMLYNSKIARIAGEALEQVPFSGASTAARREAFNKAVMKTIGANPDKTALTPDVFDHALRQSGGKIGQIAEKTPVPIDKEFQEALDAHVISADKFQTADVAKVVHNYVQELKSKAGDDGVIPGTAFRRINSQIGRQVRTSANGDLKHALGELQDDMLDAMGKNLSPEDQLAWMSARRQYANAKAIEPLVAKSATGDMSPAALMGAVTSTKSAKSAMARGAGGDLGEVARIGQKFGKEPASSGTAERSAVYGGLAGGALTHPTATAGVYGLANAYNRLGPSLSRYLLKDRDQ